MVKQVELKVKGRVQGVFYRSEACKKASDLGIKGFAHNNSDGTVSVVAQGEEEPLKQFIKWCWEGPNLAHVENIDIRYTENPKEIYSDFVIG